MSPLSSLTTPGTVAAGVTNGGSLGNRNHRHPRASNRPSQSSSSVVRSDTVVETETTADTVLGSASFAPSAAPAAFAPTPEAVADTTATAGSATTNHTSTRPGICRYGDKCSYHRKNKCRFYHPVDPVATPVPVAGAGRAEGNSATASVVRPSEAPAAAPQSAPMTGSGPALEKPRPLPARRGGVDGCDSVAKSASEPADATQASGPTKPLTKAKACRFGLGCNRQKTCKFWHPLPPGAAAEPPAAASTSEYVPSSEHEGASALDPQTDPNPITNPIPWGTAQRLETASESLGNAATIRAANWESTPVMVDAMQVEQDLLQQAYLLLPQPQPQLHPQLHHNSNHKREPLRPFPSPLHSANGGAPQANCNAMVAPRRPTTKTTPAQTRPSKRDKHTAAVNGRSDGSAPQVVSTAIAGAAMPDEASPTDPSFRANASADPVSIGATPNGQQWTCSVCTFASNPGLYLVCDVCSSERPSSASHDLVAGDGDQAVDSGASEARTANGQAEDRATEADTPKQASPSQSLEMAAPKRATPLSGTALFHSGGESLASTLPPSYNVSSVGDSKPALKQAPKNGGKTGKLRDKSNQKTARALSSSSSTNSKAKTEPDAAVQIPPDDCPPSVTTADAVTVVPPGPEESELEKKRRRMEELRRQQQEAARKSKSKKLQRRDRHMQDLAEAAEQRQAFWASQIAKEEDAADLLAQLCVAEFCRSNMEYSREAVLQTSDMMDELNLLCHEAYRALYEDEIPCRIEVKGAKKQDWNGRTGLIQYWDRAKSKYFVCLERRKSKSSQFEFVAPEHLDSVSVGVGRKKKPNQTNQPNNVFPVYVEEFYEGNDLTVDLDREIADDLFKADSVDTFLAYFVKCRDREDAEAKRLAAERKREEEEERRRRAAKRRQQEEEWTRAQREYAEEKDRLRQQREAQRNNATRRSGRQHPTRCNCPNCILEDELMRRFMEDFFFGRSRGGGGRGRTFGASFGGNFFTFRTGGGGYGSDSDSDDDDSHEDAWDEQWKHLHEGDLAAQDEEAAELLGVPVEASAIEIKRAYRAKARLYHPDSYRAENHEDGTTKQEAEDHFKKLAEAYDHMLSKFDDE